ncbi:hypothetical protein D3C78_1452200 [compost metagenome]
MGLSLGGAEREGLLSGGSRRSSNELLLPLMTRQSGVRAIHIGAGTASMSASTSVALARSFASLCRSRSSARRLASSDRMRCTLKLSWRAMVKARSTSELGK